MSAGWVGSGPRSGSKSGVTGRRPAHDAVAGTDATIGQYAATLARTDASAASVVFESNPTRSIVAPMRTRSPRGTMYVSGPYTTWLSVVAPDAATANICPRYGSTGSGRGRPAICVVHAPAASTTCDERTVAPVPAIVQLTCVVLKAIARTSLRMRWIWRDWSTATVSACRSATLSTAPSVA